MIVRESLDPLNEVGSFLVQPYSYRKGKCEKLACFYYFETEDGDQYAVKFINLGEIHGRKKNIYQTEFSTSGEEGDTKVVNKGRIFKILSTVIEIIKEFVSENEVDGLNMYPSTNFKGDDRRYKIYMAYLNKLLPEFPEWKKTWSPFDKRIILRKKT